MEELAISVSDNYRGLMVPGCKHEEMEEMEEIVFDIDKIVPLFQSKELRIN